MRIFIFLLLLTVLQASGQNKFRAFKTLSTPEKCWVIFHPFKAKKAFLITQEVLQTTDSIVKNRILNSDLNGGPADAFKHTYWMARLTQEIGQRPALKLGKAHEKGNYKTYKKGRKEDGAVPDKPSSDMDLFNNNVGSVIGKRYPGASRQSIREYVLTALKQGALRVLKKDRNGRFLTCAGSVIPQEQLRGKWENQKCLVPSSEEVKY